MKRTTPELNKVWGRALRTALMLLPLGLSGCFDDKKTDPPPASSVDLAVSVSGSGQVTSSPAGIDCGSDCAETLASGSTITLSATPGSGAMFTGWGGDCSGSTASCTLTMSASRAVTASFTFTTDPPPPAAQYTLSVNVSGSGSVTDNSTPARINCGTDCTENYADGTNVTLTASPGNNQQFSGWLGACSGTATTCLLAMTEARSVTATFTPVQRTLTVSVVGSGTVTDSSTPARINCGSDCSERYDHGALVTLTAVPVMGFQLSGWSGACIATTGTCAVTMNATQSVTATFTASNGSAQLLRDAPTANADGTTLADLAGYTLRYGTATGNYPQSIDLPLNVVTCSGTAPTTCNHTVNGLGAGTWYFTVQAYDAAGNISANSNEATRSVP